MAPFLLATLVGATMWNTFLLFCGMKLRNNWQAMQKYSHQIDIVIVVAAILAIAWWIHSRLAQRKAQAAG